MNALWMASNGTEQQKSVLLIYFICFNHSFSNKSPVFIVVAREYITIKKALKKTLLR